MLAVLPHNRCGRFKPNADATALIEISALGGNSTDDILGGQYRCHVAATLTGRLPSQAIVDVNRFSTASLQFTRVIPEIDIWRAANLMLKRYGEKAFEEGSARADEPTRASMMSLRFRSTDDSCGVPRCGWSSTSQRLGAVYYTEAVCCARGARFTLSKAPVRAMMAPRPP